MTPLFDDITRKDQRIMLAGMLSILIIIVVILILTKSIPEGNRDVAYVVLGALLGNFTNVFSFYFGSSKSETDNKTNTPSK